MDIDLEFEREVARRDKVRLLVEPLYGLDVFAHLLEREFPTAFVNEKFIINSGTWKDNTPMVPFAASVKEGRKTGCAVVYRSGKVVLTGLMAKFKWPVSEEEFRRAKEEIARGK